MSDTKRNALTPSRYDGLDRGPSGVKHRKRGEEVRELRERVVEQTQQLKEQSREIEEKEQEIELTAEVQKSLLPREMPDIKGFELAASYFAPGKAGGDYYDFLPLERGEDRRPRTDGRWVAIVADAAGHGPSATVVMAMLHSLLHAFPGPHDEPGKILAFINRQMCKKDLAGMFATAVLGILDPVGWEFHYACAGHPPPLLRESSGGAVTKLITRRGPGLALRYGARFHSRLLRLKPPDTLLLYTDGLIEALDERGEPFGIDRLKRAFATAAGGPNQIKEFLKRVVASHRGFEEQPDDQTFVVIQAVEQLRTGC